MIYLLDTDHISELQGIGIAGRRLTARRARVAPDDYGTTIVTFEEQIRGRLAQIAAFKAVAASEVLFYARFNDTLRFYHNVAVCSTRKKRRCGIRHFSQQKSEWEPKT